LLVAPHVKREVQMAKPKLLDAISSAENRA